MREEKAQLQIRAREAQLFVNKCIKEWDGNGDLCKLHEVMELPCARKTFEESHIRADSKRLGAPMGNKTMFVMTPQHPVRSFMIKIVEHPAFDVSMLLVIIY